MNKVIGYDDTPVVYDDCYLNAVDDAKGVIQPQIIITHEQVGTYNNKNYHFVPNKDNIRKDTGEYTVNSWNDACSFYSFDNRKVINEFNTNFITDYSIVYHEEPAWKSYVKEVKPLEYYFENGTIESQPYTQYFILDNVNDQILNGKIDLTNHEEHGVCGIDRCYVPGMIDLNVLANESDYYYVKNLYAPNCTTAEQLFGGLSENWQKDLQYRYYPTILENIYLPNCTRCSGHIDSIVGPKFPSLTVFNGKNVYLPKNDAIYYGGILEDCTFKYLIVSDRTAPEISKLHPVCKNNIGNIDRIKNCKFNIGYGDGDYLKVAVEEWLNILKTYRHNLELINVDIFSIYNSDQYIHINYFKS